MEYYSVINRNEIVYFASKWLEVEKIVLSDK